MSSVRVFQNSFSAGALSPSVWSRGDLQKYRSGAKRIVNGIVLAHGGISNRPGTYFVDTLPGDGVLIPFTYSVTQAYVLAFTDCSMRIYMNGSVVLDPDTDEIVEVTTPYTLADLPKLKFAQSADVMFLAHPSHPPMTLTRSDHHTWTFAEIDFAPDITAPTGLSSSQSGFTSSPTYTKTVKYKVSAVSEREVESLPSAATSQTIPTLWNSDAVIRLSWTAVTGAVRYEVYKNIRGYYAWVGSAETTSFTDDNIDGDTGTGPKENQDPFDGEDNYPGAVGIYQQRLVFGRTNNDPQTIWLSQTGSFNSLAVSWPQQDDDSITARIDSKQMNEIRHLLPLKDTLVLTSGAEFIMSPGKNSDAVSPTSIRFDLQSYWGCSDVPPVVAGNSILVVQNSGKHVRDLYYALSEDGYSGNDVSVLAENLLDSPIIAWAYQQSPYSTVWICKENGGLLTFTYMREQEIWAWSEHESSGGKFRSAACIREGEDDSVYFIVNRGDSYFVEFQKIREWGDAIEDSFFLDCGLSYEGSPVTTVSGLDHLAGQTVNALADGSVVTGLVVSAGGTVTLPFAASVVHVGLGYRMLVETLDPQIKNDAGDTIGLKRKVVDASFRVRETYGIKAGVDETALYECKFPNPATYGAPVALYSGDMKAQMPGKWGTEATMVFTQDMPLPANIQSLVITVEVGDV